MTEPHAIVIGASKGGVAALLELVAALPPGLNAVVGVVLHVGSQHSILPELLARRGRWPALHAVDGQALERGTIYVAPPDHHMLFGARALRVMRGPRENHSRPAIDPLFRSAALEWRERAIGVVLTGDLDDGTAGLAAIKACGGLAIVQDPATAFEPGMPQSALSHVAVDHCLPLSEIAPALVRLAGVANGYVPAPPPAQLLQEQAIFEGRQPMENLSAVATPSPLTCPDCGGGLWELNGKQPLRYRCHTGHGYSALSLKHAQGVATDHALWNSLRALQERQVMLQRLADGADAAGQPALAADHRREAERIRAQVKVLTALVAGERGAA